MKALVSIRAGLLDDGNLLKEFECGCLHTLGISLGYRLAALEARRISMLYGTSLECVLTAQHVRAGLRELATVSMEVCICEEEHISPCTKTMMCLHREDKPGAAIIVVSPGQLAERINPEYGEAYLRLPHIPRLNLGPAEAAILEPPKGRHYSLR